MEQLQQKLRLERNRWRRACWISLAILVVLSLGGKLWLDYRYEAAKASRRATHHVLVKQQQQLRQTAQRLYHLGATKTQIEKALGLTNPLPTFRDNHGRKAIRYTHPTLGATMHFNFGRDGHATGYGWQSSTAQILPPSVSRLDVEWAVWRIGAWLVPVSGKWFVPVALIPWIAILVWSHNVPRHRLWVDFALASWSVFCSLIWLASPHYDLTPHGIMSNDRLFWGVLMLIGTAAVLGYHHEKSFGPNACQVCGYNLTGNVTGRCPECGAVVAGQFVP